MAAKKGIPLRLHRVIYKLIDELKEELSGKLTPVTEENIIGEFIATISVNPDKIVYIYIWNQKCNTHIEFV